MKFLSTLILLVPAVSSAKSSSNGKQAFGVGATPRSQALLEKVRPIRHRQASKVPPKKDLALEVTAAAISQRGGGSSFLQEHKNALTGALAMTALERAINKWLVAKSIAFPAMLAGCVGLFTILVLADLISPGLGESLYTSLLPGSNLLAKWFPVLFVPGLVLLPLAPSIGNGVEVTKFIGVAVIGLIYSMTTTAYAVMAMRASKGALITSPPIVPKNKIPRKINSKAPAPAAPKAYRDSTMSFLAKATVLSGVISILATQAGNEYATPVRTIFFFLTTFSTFVWGARLPSTITKIVHPLIISAVLTLGVIQGTSRATGAEFLDVLKTYKTGNLAFMSTGAADIMMFLLGPAVVSFAISMYSRRQLLKENLFIVLVAMVVSSAGGLFGTAVFVRLIQLGGSNGLMVRLSTLSRNVTTALAIACTNILEGDVSLAVLIVVITGVLGATYGRTFLDALGIHDPVTRGLAVGAAAQGLGVTSMMSEPDAYPFAAMSMILTAIAATVLVSIPSVKELLVNLSKG